MSDSTRMNIDVILGVAYASLMSKWVYEYALFRPTFKRMYVRTYHKLYRKLLCQGGAFLQHHTQRQVSVHICTTTISRCLPMPYLTALRIWHIVCSVREGTLLKKRATLAYTVELQLVCVIMLNMASFSTSIKCAFHLK